LNERSFKDGAMPKPDKRNDILQAALELLAEQGFHGAPMALIASRAGVGAGTIYCHFESRDELIHQLLRDIEGRIAARIQDGDADSLPIRHRFTHICTVIFNYFIDHPLEFRYLEQFHNSPYGVEHRRDKIFGRGDKPLVCRDLFNQGVAEGVIKDLPLVVLYGLTFGPLLALARDHILGFVTLDQALIERIIDSCWDGVRR
jgi:AcrR family transcriptional regulator